MQIWGNATKLIIPQLDPLEYGWYYPKTGENIKIHGSPWQFSETPSNPGFAPGLGEHNNEILSSIGYSESQIKDLQDMNAI